MKKIIGYLKLFHVEYFNWVLYLFVALFIAALIAFNYYFDFEDSYIDSFYGKHVRALLFFAYHALAFYGVLLIIWLHDKSKMKITWQFLLKSAIGLAILGFDRSVFPFISKLVLNNFNRVDYRFYFKILYNLYGLFTIGFALFLVKLFFDPKGGDGLYGLKFRNAGIKPYWIMLAIMVPVVFIGTYLPGFLEYYPTFKRSGGGEFASFHALPQAVGIVLYEIAYLFDFLNTELFFRGFLVIGLSKMLGKNVVLPMAATYAVLHFGKPMGEAISSVFGGYILGIIALYSRNIWGGVFIHGGIALLMELFAFWRQ
ncbi:MAG TPA: CPBP family intramembrane glutamic endopeptidase [Prolixibacteraceae bacterium]|nr:CPBP family intramembrane glutamic endopeptidase [Prolixibacteraceae bacterium]